ncbi:MAG TPA: NAD(P)/FAD-dependent oxidoreductase [Conexibacter sp.]|nr:NAD(P)/FAD-dependent oxidoreductase [Conexibacter sp.]
MPDRYDAIVVGSGPNGLACAITLAERGWSTLVLEEQDRPGGGLSTEELTLPGYRHDVFSAVHPAAVASPVFERWPLARYGLEWVHPDVPVAHPLPGGRAISLHRDLERTRRSLNAAGAGDGDRWQELASRHLRRFEGMRRTMLSGFPPLAGGARLLADLRVRGTLEMSRLLLMSMRDFARELFANDAAAAWLYGASQHGDVPPTEAGSAIMGLYLQLLGHRVGYPSPRGGAGELAAALVAHLAALGGSVRTGARADRIVVRHGRVVGVCVGDELLQTERLLCDVTPRGLLAMDAGALPDGYRRRLARYRYGTGAVKVDWALREAIPWEAADARAAGTVHVCGPTATIEEYAASLRGARLHPRPFVLLGQQSIADPTRTPDGGHTAWAYVRRPRQAPPDRALVDEQVELIEAQVERFAPGFRDRIVARHVLSPEDLARRNRNLVGGDVGAGSYALDQMVFRPVPSLSPYRTPVRGLYLASAATFPGGAVHGVCGHAAARCALRDARTPRR